MRHVVLGGPDNNICTGARQGSWRPCIPQSVSTKQLMNLIEIANKLPGERQAIPEEVISLSIPTFCNIYNKSLVVPYYCEESSQTSFASFGYYSTDGVCLPRYYGAANEPAFDYSFGILLMNFAAFFYMFIVYMLLYCSASYKNNQAKSNNANTVSQAQAKRSKDLSGTIMRIIITDFLCWIPICIMSFLSFGGVEISGIAYPITAIFLIPINSAVNPWIYSSFLTRKIKKIPSLIRIQMQRRQSS